MLKTAHRGASAAEPENTMAAFKRALQMGADAIELDVRRCKSGEMVVIHDATVDRTSNGTGRVKDLTLKQLRQLDFGNGERICTLEEMIQGLAGGCRDKSNPKFFVELKGPGSKRVAAVLHNAVAHGGYRYDDFTVIGFNHAQLFQFKRQNPQIDTGLSFPGRHPVESRLMVPLAKRMRASAINPEHALITPELVRKAHAAGLTVNTWTVNGHEDIKRVADAGVDAIMSDHPDRLTLLEKTLRKSASKQAAAL